MSRTRPPVPLSAAIGQRLRLLREQEGVRQEDVASSARNCGLHHWTRSTVAAVELGRRALSFAEAVVLPIVLYGVGVRVELADLLPDEGTIALTVYETPGKLPLQRTIDASVLRRILSGHARRAAADLSNALLDIAAKVAPEHLAALGDTETKAAARIGMTPLALAQAAVRLWGRSLSEERERRLATRDTKGVDRRAIQALRGHVTRELLAELEAAAR